MVAYHCKSQGHTWQFLLPVWWALVAMEHVPSTVLILLACHKNADRASTGCHLAISVGEEGEVV